MAENSGFFNAHLVNGEYDRAYHAENFAKYFASFIGNGVFADKANELAVHQKDTANMSVRVLPGQGWINGYWYENTDELSLSIDVADGVLNRIDLIVLRWDNFERVIRLAVKKGTPSSVAYPPSILRNGDFYELKLAEIYVKAGSTKIIQADITDTRLITNDCGYVTGVVKQVNTTDFGLQLNSFITESIKEYKEYFKQLKAQGTTDVQELIADLEELLVDNDLAIISREIEHLKDIAIESTEYRGCYYRIFENEVEWINPPAQYGVEYRTTERWQNKPVYQKTFYAASLPNNSFMTIEVAAEYDLIISLEGFAIDSDNNTFHPFPIITNGITPVAAITHFEGDGGTGGIIVVKTVADVSNLKAYFTIKYTKS